MKQIYVANCIEDGERFTSTFKTAETNKEKLYDIGQELASEWGAECISVKKLVLKDIVRVTYLDGSKKPYEATKKAFEKWIRERHPNVAITYPLTTKTQRFELVKEESPKDVYDYDAETASVKG